MLYIKYSVYMKTIQKVNFDISENVKKRVAYSRDF